MGIQIIANIDANQQVLGRVSGFANFNPLPAFPELVAGDSKVVDLFLTSTEGRLNLQDYSVIRLGLGQINGRPTGGSYTLEGEQLAFNHDAAALQTIITSEIAACTVTQVSPFVFVVQFGANGAQVLPTVDSTGLSPKSTVNVKRLIAGDVSTAERWILRTYRNPIALVSDFSNLGDDGVRGALEMGTEGVYGLFSGGATEASTTAELEVTDVNGDIQTLFQIPVTIRGEVLGEGVPAVVAFESLVTASDLEDRFATANTVWVSKSGNDSTGVRARFDLPFLTVGAAQTAAQSGDTIVVLPGDYSAETALAGKDGVTYQGLDGAILPAFNVVTNITIKGSGLCQSLTCNSATAVMDMPGMNAVASITCIGGTQTAGNAGTYIFCEGGTQTAGNAGTYIFCQGGTQTAGNAGTSINCFGGTQTAGNAGTSIECFGGNQTIRITDQAHDGTGFAPIYLQGSGNLNLYGGTSKTTESGGTVFNIASNWSGKLFIDGVKIVATTVGTDEATTGITYGTGVTGKVTLKDVTIITAQDGTGTAKSIDAPSAQTVYVQGSLNQTHAIDADITLAGGDAITNAAFE